MTPWYKQDSFWRTLYPYMFDERRLAKTPSEVQGIIRLVRLKKHDKILDVGCGAGRHLLELAKQGFTRLSGIDQSPTYIALAKEQSAAAGYSIALSVQDILTYSSPPTHTAVLCLFSTFGYFDDPADNMQALRTMYDTLQPGGRLLLDVRGKENFAYNFDAQSWLKTNDSWVLSKRVALDDFSKIQNTWTVIKDGRMQDFVFTHWIYSAQEIKNMLRAAGFGDVRIFGGFDGADYSPSSARLIAVAARGSSP